ncbi:MAG: class II aldolase/adducin family protein [Bacteroidota bacterium]
MLHSARHIIRDLLAVCHRMYEKGFVTATDGNVSVRLADAGILVTGTGVCKGFVTEDDLVVVNERGDVIVGNTSPSSELGLHLFIYQQRSDVQAIVHGHPTYATGFATARIPLTACLYPEIIVGLGSIPLAEYATPSTREVVDAIAQYVSNADAILLANHGVVAYGNTLSDAYFKLEKVEHAAHITFVARLLGGEVPLTSGELESLRRISLESYGKEFTSKVACEPRLWDGGRDERTGRVYEEEEVRRMMERVIEKMESHKPT